MSQADTAVSAYNTQAEARETGVIDKQYLKGIPGILKLVEAGLALIAFICVTATGWCIATPATTGFFNFITMASCVLTLFLWVILLFKLKARIFKCDCINWPLVEVCYYSAVVVMLFFGSLFLALHYCHGGHQAGAAFGFLALAAYIVDLVFSVRAFMALRSGSQANTGGGTTNAATAYEEPKY